MSSSFDRLVARALRQPSLPATPCPAPESLAAYLDHALDRSERDAVERHASVCPRCAQHLAALVQLEDRLAAGTVSAGGGERPWWLQWQWLVPAAAMVVVFAVWTSLPPDQVADLTAPRGQTPTGGQTPAQGQTSDALRPQQQPLPATRPAPAALARDAARRADAEPAKKKTEEAAPESRAQATPTREAVAAPDQANAAPRRADAPREREIAATKPRDTALERKETAPGGSQIASVQALDKATPPGAAGGIAGAAAPAAPPSLAAANRAKAEAAFLVIPSPDPRVSWRVAPPRLERSTDAGRTWQPEQAPPLPGGLTGSAPTPDTCWLAGTDGLVLRRDPTGAWTRVTSPSTSTIVRIDARSADEAVVTTADGRTFRTIDGGKTWMR